MFSKNIIALFCVVCFIEKSNTAGEDEISEASTSMSKEYQASTSTSTVNKIQKLNTMRTSEQWQELLNKYDSNNKGFISDEELQKLIYNEFGGFLTIRQAATYANLINLEVSERGQIGWKQLEIMCPIIDILTQRTISKKYEKFNRDDTSKVDNFTVKIFQTFPEVFKYDTEVLELVELLQQNDQFPITFPIQLSTRFEEIIKMLEASVKMENLYAGFELLDKDKDGIINAEDLAFGIEGIDQTPANANEVADMIKAADLNGDGVVDFLEYIVMMIQRTTEFTLTRKQLATAAKNLQDIDINDLNLTKHDLDDINRVVSSNLSFKGYRTLGSRK